MEGQATTTGVVQDPRWAVKSRPQDAAAAAAQALQQQRPGQSLQQQQVAKVQQQQQRGGSPGSPGVEDKDGERPGYFSIVFLAAWVAIIAPIGEGAFSRVYEGVYTNPQTRDRSVVAVKVLKKNKLQRRSDCLRFIKEAKIMTKITHPNITACFGIGKYEDDDPHNPGSLFIVQELVKGGNLLHKVYKQMLNVQRTIYTSQEALNWMINVAEGMQYLHTITPTKPMIIHRDLKLENIMLAPTSNGIVAKLVDFGLHKVIDDRIKKTIKRVASEVVIGSSLGLNLPQQGGEGELEEEDELEAALAAQRAEKAAAGGAGAGAGEAAAGAAGAGAGAGPSPLDGPRSPLRLQPRRQMSRLGSSSLMATTPEEDEDELAAASGNSCTSAAAPSPSPLSSGAGMGAGATREVEASGVSGSALGTMPSGGPPLGEPRTAEPTARLRAPPKKQSSMQKLMAKMKEVKLRLTGKQGESSSSPLGLYSATAQSTSAASSVAAPTLDPATKEKEDLLNRLVAQQVTAQQKQEASPSVDSTAGPAEGQVAGGAGATEGPMAGAAPKKRAPPRRAVTWVNEIRYNLTEAVGSWAYMAPEVVLGHPYNEKVDVFSFGVILFEILNRKLMLVDEIKDDPRKDAQDYAERVARGFRPEVPWRWPSQLVELITSCWAQDPHMRPNFTAVVDILKQINSTGQIGRLDVLQLSTNSAYI